MEKKNSGLSLFLSRETLGEFFTALERKHIVSIEKRSCISLQLKSNLILPKADWIFFLSPSGVELFAEEFDASPYKIGVIGPGTERAANEQGWKVSFSPKSTDPKEGINEFAERLPESETVIMACGDKSLKRMHGVVPANQLIEWEFYENIPRQHIAESKADYLIFTAPSNANAYLDMHDLNENQTVVAIGKTTDEALEKRGILNKICAEYPTEEGIWTAILLNTSIVL